MGPPRERSGGGGLSLGQVPLPLTHFRAKTFARTAVGGDAG